MRVTLLDAEPDDARSETETPATTLVAEVPIVPAAPPLAMRPVEDAEWTFRN